MPVIFRTAGLLILSNLFMTFAWYAHLKNLSTRGRYVAALASWGRGQYSNGETGGTASVRQR